MGLFAKDESIIISAWDANPQKIYRCTCCHGLVKYRRSKLQFPHFYHLKRSLSCRLYSKSDQHLLIQLAIQKKLLPNQIVLEKPFPSINRIADVVWESKKRVFEVQCSSMTLEEAKMRTKEYASLGYTVTWILYDEFFNKRRIKSAEKWIRSQSSFFVTKTCFFYDQDELIQGTKRLQKGRKIPISISSPNTTCKTIEREVPNQQNNLFSNLLKAYHRLINKFL